MPHPYFDRKSPRHPAFDYRTRAAYFVTIVTHGWMHLFGAVVDGEMQPSRPGDIVTEEWYRSESLRQEIVLDAWVVMPNHVHGIVCLVDPGTDAVTPRGYDLSRISSGTGTGLRDAGTGDGDPPTERTRDDGMGDGDMPTERTRCNASLAGNGRGGSPGGASYRDDGRSDDDGTHRRTRNGRPWRPPRSLSSMVGGFKGAVTRRIRAAMGDSDLRVWQPRFDDHILRDERDWRTHRRYIRLNPYRWWLKYGNPS